MDFNYKTSFFFVSMSKPKQIVSLAFLKSPPRAVSTAAARSCTIASCAGGVACGCEIDLHMHGAPHIMHTHILAF